MDFWRNSTLFFGAAAFCKKKIGDFRRRPQKWKWPKKKPKNSKMKICPKMKINQKMKMTSIEKTNKKVKSTCLFQVAFEHWNESYPWKLIYSRFTQLMGSPLITQGHLSCDFLWRVWSKFSTMSRLVPYTLHFLHWITLNELCSGIQWMRKFQGWYK